MPPLTWRNVDAPSFAGSLDGLRTASTMLGNATRSGIDLIDTIKQTNEEGADRAILNRAMAIDDPAAYAAAKANGTLVGGDLPNASLATLRDVDNRSGTLLNRAVTQQTLDQTGWVNNRTRDRDARLTAAAPDIALANVLSRDNNQADLTKLLSTSATLRALDPDQLAGIFTGADTLTNSAQTRRDWDTKARIAADGETGQQEWNTISRDNATLGDVQKAVNARASSLTPSAYANLVNRARAAGYNVNGPIGSGASGDLGIAAPTSAAPTVSAGSSGSGSLMDRFVDGLAKLETAGGAKTIKGPNGEDSFNLFNVKDFSKEGTGFRAKDTAEGSNDRYRVYSSPQAAREDLMGLLARKYPKALTAKNGREFAQALKDGGYATDSDYVEKLTAVIGDTPNVVSSGSPAAPAQNNATALLNQAMSRSDITRKQLRERAGQNQANEIFPDLDKLQFDRRVPAEVASELVGPNGVYSGSNRGTIAAQINKLIERSGDRISAATAGRILASNSDRSDSLITRAGSRVADIFRENDSTPNLAGGMRIDDAGAYRMLDNVLSGASSRQQTAQASLGATDELVQSLQERYNAADALYQQMLTQSKSRPGLAANLAGYKQKRDDAEKALSLAVQSVNNTDTLTPQFNRPVARTRGATGSW